MIPASSIISNSSTESDATDVSWLSRSEVVRRENLRKAEDRLLLMYQQRPIFDGYWASLSLDALVHLCVVFSRLRLFLFEHPDLVVLRERFDVSLVYGALPSCRTLFDVLHVFRPREAVIRFDPWLTIPHDFLQSFNGVQLGVLDMHLNQMDRFLDGRIAVDTLRLYQTALVPAHVTESVLFCVRRVSR